MLEEPEDQEKYTTLIVFLVICSFEVISTYVLYQMPIKKLYVDGILLFFCVLEAYYLLKLAYQKRLKLLRKFKKIFRKL